MISIFEKEETVNSIQSSLNKKIKNILLDKENNWLIIEFDDLTRLKIFDDGQSCCEIRYMTTDDILSDFVGHIFKKIELKNGETKEFEYNYNEILFLEIITDKGFFQIVNHNEHNGYYGGFAISAELIKEEIYE